MNRTFEVELADDPVVGDVLDVDVPRTPAAAIPEKRPGGRISLRR